jgi:guanylate kinase
MLRYRVLNRSKRHRCAVRFIKPPSFEALEARLRGRGTESEEDIQKRLARAKVELEYADAQSNDKIINDNVENAYQELGEFLFEPA